MADLIRNVLAAIGALTVTVWLLGAVLAVRTVLRERRAAKRPLPDLDQPSPEALKRLWADLEALERGEKP